MSRIHQRDRGQRIVASAAGLVALLAGGCVQWPGEVSRGSDEVGAGSPRARSGGVSRRAGGAGTQAVRPPPAFPDALRAPVHRIDTDAVALSTFGGAWDRQAMPIDADEPRARPSAPGAGPSVNTPEGARSETSVSRISFATEGADFDPDASRDGRFIVFASTQHEASPDIYVKGVESRVVTQLTGDPAQDVMPAFSPDGSMVAFASNRAGNWDVYVMPASGGNAVRVTDTSAHELHPSWSPDGASLVYCRLGDVSGQWELWITDAINSGVAHFVGYGLFPEWCPKGGTGEAGADKILFQRGRQRGDRAFGIWTIDYRDERASNPTEIASTPNAACINPTWSPDGRWIVFANVPAGTADAPSGLARPRAADLWMADLNGTARIRLTGGPGLSLMPAWGPNGRIFFVSNRSGIDNIWSLNAQEAVRLAGSAAARQDVANVPEGGAQEPDR